MNQDHIILNNIRC